MLTLLQIKNVPKNYPQLPFGRQLEYRHIIADFKATAKTTHLSQKRQSYQKAIKEFKALNNVEYFFTQFHNDPNYKDDCFEFFYTQKKETTPK